MARRRVVQVLGVASAVTRRRQVHRTARVEVVLRDLDAELLQLDGGLDDRSGHAGVEMPFNVAVDCHTYSQPVFTSHQSSKGEQG